MSAASESFDWTDGIKGSWFHVTANCFGLGACLIDERYGIFRKPQHAEMHQIPSIPPASVLIGYLSLGLESLGEAAHVVLEGTLVAEELNVGTVDTDAALLALGDVLLATEGSETPVLGDDDLLATGELVLRAAESLDGDSAR